MQIAVLLIRWLTLGVVVLGAWAWWSLENVQDEGWAGPLIRLGVEVASAPWFWLALVGWLFAGRRAKVLDFEAQSTTYRSDSNHPHQPMPLEGSGSSMPSAGASAGGSGRQEPILATGSDRSRRDEKTRRLRLAALLKGRKPDVTAFVDALLIEASEAGASDVHLQPHEGPSRVTLRVRGARQEIAQYPAGLHGDVVRRVKVLAGLSSYAGDQAQDGSFRFETPGGPTHVRVSTVPSSHGEAIALRLAGRATAMEPTSLGFEVPDLDRFTALLREPQGLLVLTGPTGCGKTTTLYSSLGYIHGQRGATTHLASIEDPVEVELPFVQQVAIDRSRKIGFPEALRALLRQDPDVLMVGEIRDAETAKVAVQAGLSGHLILTTMHAESAAGVFPRLIDLGVEPFLAGSSVVGCVSQRLVGRLCGSCRHPQAPDKKQRARLVELGADPQARFYTAAGCARCGRSGFVGRRAIFEVLALDSELRQRVAGRSPVDELQRAFVESGAKTLFQSGLPAAIRGEVSLDDLLRLAGAP